MLQVFGCASTNIRQIEEVSLWVIHHNRRSSYIVVLEDDNIADLKPLILWYSDPNIPNQTGLTYSSNHC